MSKHSAKSGKIEPLYISEIFTDMVSFINCLVGLQKITNFVRDSGVAKLHGILTSLHNKKLLKRNESRRRYVAFYNSVIHGLGLLYLLNKGVATADLCLMFLLCFRV